MYTCTVIIIIALVSGSMPNISLIFFIQCIFNLFDEKKYECVLHFENIFFHKFIKNATRQRTVRHDNGHIRLCIYNQKTFVLQNNFQKILKNFHMNFKKEWKQSGYLFFVTNLYKINRFVFLFPACTNNSCFLTLTSKN